MKGGLRTGWSCLSRRFMPRGFFMILLCSFILVGHLYSQEVIVARETKPEAPKQTPPPEQTPAESATQAKKSGQSDSEAASTPRPAVPETPRPVKREPRSEQTNTSHRTSSRAAKPDAAGVVRPTFMESGRSEPSATPLSKGQTPAP